MKPNNFAYTDDTSLTSLSIKIKEPLFTQLTKKESFTKAVKYETILS